MSDVQLFSEARAMQNRGRLLELYAKSGGLPERRDPTAATVATQRYQSPGTPMIPQWNADTAIQWAFYANVIVYRCMQILANTVAACPFRTGKTPPKQPGGVTDFNENARLAQLLGPPPGGPAPMLTARRLWAWTVVQRTVTGKHGWEIETTQRAGKGEVVALWPLVSSMLRAVPSTSGASWWSRFEYGPEYDPAKSRNLNIDQVLYGWDPSANDFRQPESCLQAARLDISIAVMMDRYSVGFLRNDARPAAVVVTDAFASDEDFRRWKLQWYGEFGGPDNANKTAFMEMPDGSALKPSEAMFVQTLGLSQKDAKFIEQHQASLERVAMACGVPWSKLDASGRTFDNAGEEDETFWMLTMLPKLSDFADEVNIQLAPRVGSEVGWFDLSHVKVFQPQRRFTSMQDASFALADDVVVINEVRDDIGLAPVDWGDEPVHPAAAAGELPAAPARSEEPEVRAALVHSHMHVHSDGTIHSHLHRHPDGTVDHGDFAQVPHTHGHVASKRRALGDQQAGVLRTVIEPHVAQRREVDRTEERARLWRSTDATVRTLEARWTRGMRRLFTRQQKAVLSRLEGNRGRRALADGIPNADEIFDPSFWTDETASDVEALYELVAAAGFARVSAQFGISFDLEAAYARTFITNRSNQLAGQVTDTTYNQITDQLAEGVAAGESIPDLAKRIRTVFDQADKTRSVTIARTETVSAFNGSASLAAAQLPDDVVGGQEWIATQDGRTRDDHAEADGQVVAIGEPFMVGGEALAYPGDPSGSTEETVNCRCTIGMLTPDEMKERGARPGRRMPLDSALQFLELFNEVTPHTVAVA